MGLVNIKEYSGKALLGLAAGVIMIALVTWIRLSLSAVVGTDMPLLLYVFAVLPAAAIGGWPAGVMTAALAVMTGYSAIIGPRMFGDSAESIRTIAFILESVAISALLDIVQRRSRHARQLAAELALERDNVARMALEDPLTGLRNRRAFQSDLMTEMARAMREGMPLTLVMADIDGLKQTNDRFGHETGDALLVATASALAGCCRRADAVYRIGGDEFALLMPDTSPREFDEPYRRFSQAFAEVGRVYEGAGVSIGWAYMPQDTMDPDELVRLADGRMYQNKAARHRVENGRKRWHEHKIAGFE